MRIRDKVVVRSPEVRERDPEADGEVVQVLRRGHRVGRGHHERGRAETAVHLETGNSSAAGEV